MLYPLSYRGSAVEAIRRRSFTVLRGSRYRYLAGSHQHLGATVGQSMTCTLLGTLGNSGERKPL